MKPEKSALNIEIEKIENNFFSKEIKKKRANAFHYLCMSILSNIDYEDIKESDIVDGNDENGIDVINVNELDEDSIITIINCKSGKDNYSENDLKKLRRGLEYVFEEKENVYKKLKNFKLVKRIADIRDIKDSIIYINIFYSVFNGSKINDKVERERKSIEKKFSKLISFEYPKAKLSINIINGASLYKKKLSLMESLKHKEIEIEYYDKERILKPEVISNGVLGYLLTVKGSAIAKLVHENGEKLFEKNVRGWFKYKKSNNEIYETCKSDKANLFWFLNNGITIVGDSATPNSDKGVIKIKNLQIVNGQQTARVLYEAFQKKELKEEVKVLCRVYTGGGEGFVNSIAKATNNQISVGNRDLMSNDPKQLAIAEFFGKFDIFYERQREQRRPEKFIDIISSRLLAQISLSLICRKPSVAMRNREGDMFNINKYYTEIFEQDPKKLLLAYLVYKYCFGRRKQDDELSFYASLHIATMVWNKNSKKMDKLFSSLQNKLPKLNLSKEYSSSYKAIDDLIKQNKKEDFISIGHYISRLEFESLLNGKL
ncbi:MAG: AIPR family protein [bacterium]|nr:AIPR family protein [bacterium]